MEICRWDCFSVLVVEHPMQLDQDDLARSLAGSHGTVAALQSIPPLADTIEWMKNCQWACSVVLVV